ncbi:MAG TPA: glycogen debranching N-terminal domain-containing protein [Polyangia bacterium]|jgi:glycogen debranching enzyme|nr:glycogen debranching N-terminal domain-containing protein [Polyangia bacterium]
MSLNTVSILDGNSFVVSDRRGDIDASPIDTQGLFLDDTRFLSRWILTVNGIRPSVLSVDEQEYFQVQFFEAVTTSTIYVDSHLSVARKRAVGKGFHEEILVENHDKQAMDLDIQVDAAADFADLFEVKDKLQKKGELYTKATSDRLTLGYKRDRFVRETYISANQKGQVDEKGFHFKVHLPPRTSWTVSLDVQASNRATGDADRRSKADVDAWVQSAPRLVCSWDPLHLIYKRSLVDLAALRFRTGLTGGALPAAGLPWFMAVFGRDSLITSFQAMPFAPEMAATTLRTLALFQARQEDPFRDAEPGKILHELRLGEMTAFEERPHSPYYGAADATMLFLIVLEEYVRWSGDQGLARELEREARNAVAWIDRYGDRDHDGYVEYERRNKETGLENQCWKDSWDSIAFADGTLAPLPRATCELQGYVYDAKRRVARLAREIWNDPSWAQQLEREAEDLKQRFNRDFWIPERNFFALALDGNKRKVDSLTSNIGHLLWSGIADDDKAESCVKHLMSDALFSGWGVRTMASSEGSYNPIGYHVGTIWPHDNSFIAWGLRQSGYRAEAALISRAMLEAADLFGGRLPEAFGGFPRSDTHYPVEYPTACSPQAWATGAPLLLLRTLLGLESDGTHLIVDPAIPEPLGRIELLDIPGVWGRMDAFGRARAAH